MMERYFFKSGHDCCVAFYNTTNNNRWGGSGSSEEEVGGGLCLIEDVCKSTATTAAAAEKNGKEGTTTNNGNNEKGEQQVQVKISKWQQQDDYCKPKKKKQCVKDEACKWFYENGGSCLGYWENNENYNTEEKNGGVVGTTDSPTPAPLPTLEEGVVVDCESQKWHESQVEGMTWYVHIMCKSSPQFVFDVVFPSWSGLMLTHLYQLSVLHLIIYYIQHKRWKLSNLVG